MVERTPEEHPLLMLQRHCFWGALRLRSRSQGTHVIDELLSPTVACLVPTHVDAVVMEQSYEPGLHTSDLIRVCWPCLPDFEGGATEGVLGVFTVATHPPDAEPGQQ